MSYPFTRHQCYSSLENRLFVQDSPDKIALSISGSLPLCHVVGLKQTTIVERNYPELNIASLSEGDNTFDFVVSDFVVEHVEADPLTMFNEQSRILKPGGFVVCTTAFVYMYHGSPNDFWRFSEDTFRFLCEKTSLEVVNIGSWGSLNALAAIHEGHSDYMVGTGQVEPLERLANFSDPRYPIVTWLIAKKK
jgi:SAM-dependent methyltransferase